MSTSNPEWIGRGGSGVGVTIKGVFVEVGKGDIMYKSPWFTLRADLTFYCAYSY